MAQHVKTVEEVLSGAEAERLRLRNHHQAAEQAARGVMQLIEQKYGLGLAAVAKKHEKEIAALIFAVYIERKPL